MSYPSVNYIYCFVPGCKNTSVSAPDKLFFQVPKGDIRKKWCIAVGRDTSLSRTSQRRCCQDHFVLEEDVHNWIYYKALMDAGRLPILRLKKDALPHLCLPHDNTERNDQVSKDVDVTKKQIISGLEEHCSTGENSVKDTTRQSLKYTLFSKTDSALIRREQSHSLESRGTKRGLEVIKIPQQLPQTAKILKRSEVFQTQRRANILSYRPEKAPLSSTYAADVQHSDLTSYYGEGSYRFTSEILEQISSFGVHFLSQ